MKTAEMQEIAEIIDLVLTHKKVDEAKERVQALTSRFPLFQK